MKRKQLVLPNSVVSNPNYSTNIIKNGIEYYSNKSTGLSNNNTPFDIEEDNNFCNYVNLMATKVNSEVVDFSVPNQQITNEGRI